MNYPLELSFKIAAFAQQIRVKDAAGSPVCYVRRKIMKLKEVVEVFTSEDRSNKLCEIKADKVIDFSATYRFTDESGRNFGAIQRKGMRSLWKSHYLLSVNDEVDMELHEENPWAKVMDSLLGEVPIVGMFTGYMFHPSFLITRADTGEEVLRIKKQPAFFEGKFTLEKLGEFDQADELRLLMSVLMMVCLERRRG